MAIISSRVDRGIESNRRYQYWASGAPGVNWTVLDIIDVEQTLGRPARYLRIDTGTGCDLQVRINCRVTRYPMRSSALNNPPMPSLEDAETVTDSSQNAINLDAESSFVLSDVMPIHDVQLAVWTTGQFEVIIS